MIQPSCLGQDGKPTPISHIMQMTENIKISPEASSDSDWTYSILFFFTSKGKEWNTKITTTIPTKIIINNINDKKRQNTLFPHFISIFVKWIKKNIYSISYDGNFLQLLYEDKMMSSKNTNLKTSYKHSNIKSPEKQNP